MATVSGNPPALTNQRNTVFESDLNRMKREDLRVVLYQLAGQLVRTAIDNRDSYLHKKRNYSVISSDGSSNSGCNNVPQCNDCNRRNNSEDKGMEARKVSLSSVPPDKDLCNVTTEDLPSCLSCEVYLEGTTDSGASPDFQDENDPCVGGESENHSEQDNGLNDFCTSSQKDQRSLSGENGYNTSIDLLEIFKRSSNIAQLTSELQKNLVNVSNMNIHFDSCLDFAFALNRLCRFVLSIIERCSENCDATAMSKWYEMTYNDYAIYEDDIISRLADEKGRGHQDEKQPDATAAAQLVRSMLLQGKGKSGRRDFSTQTDLLYQDYVNLLSMEDDVYEEMRLLKSEAEIVREENKDLCDINDALRSRIELISLNNDELLVNQDELLNEISRQREENQTLRNNFNRVLYDYNRLENEMQTLQFDYEDLNIEKELLINRLNLKEQECKSLRDRHDSAVRKIKIMQEKIESVKGLHEEGKVMKRKDWEEWSKLRSQLSATENALQDVRRQKSKLLRELEQTKERLRRNHSEASRADEAISIVEERFSRGKRCRDRVKENSEDDHAFDSNGDNKEKGAISSCFHTLESNSDSANIKTAKARKPIQSNRVRSIIRALTSEGSYDCEEDSPTSSEDDKSDFLFCGVTDLTARKRVENELYEAESKSAQLDLVKDNSCFDDNELAMTEQDDEQCQSDSSTVSRIPREELAQDDSPRRRSDRIQAKPSQLSPNSSSLPLELYTLEEAD